jgi:histidinol-phosphatase
VPAQYADELRFARTFAHRAAARLRTLRRDVLRIETKADQSPVTNADLEVNHDFIDAVGHTFPDDGVLGEEASRPGAGPRTWVIDPVDGTRQLILGVPTFMISIALVVEGRPVVAVAENPSTREVYWAVEGRGAHRGRDRLRVSTRDGVSSEAVVSAGGGTLTRPGLEADGLLRLTVQPELTSVVHRFPWPSVFSGCKVAEGFWDADLYGQRAAHDVAAVCLLVREAGGRVTDRQGHDQRYDGPVNGCIASNGLVHDALVESWRPS